MNPRPQDIEKELDSLQAGEGLYLRSTLGKGISTPGERITDKKQLQEYKRVLLARIMSQVRRTQGKSAKDARVYAKEVWDSIYTVKVEATD
jgi:hypothetical protein